MCETKSFSHAKSSKLRLHEICSTSELYYLPLIRALVFHLDFNAYQQYTKR
jgi:hypothetical protein